MTENSPSRYGEKAGEPKSLPKDPHAPPPLLTDLDEAEIRADIREMRADIERHRERPLVDRDRRNEYINRTEREIARLERLLACG